MAEKPNGAGFLKKSSDWITKSMINSSPEINQTSEMQRTEGVANMFYEMADDGKGLVADKEETKEIFSSIGRETAQGNYVQAERIMEGNVDWNDVLRGAAVELNQLDQHRRGVEPMTIDDAVAAISQRAREFEMASKERGGAMSDLENSMTLDNMVSDMQSVGIDGLNAALEYAEGSLRSKTNIAENVMRMESMSPEDKVSFLKGWQEMRDIRDAVYEERRRRTESGDKKSGIAERLSAVRNDTYRNLDNLFTQAQIPEDDSQRRDFLERVSNMSETELHFLDSALNVTARRTTRDTMALRGQIIDLASRGFSLKDVESRQRNDDQKEIAKIRTELALKTEVESPSNTVGMTEEQIERSRKRIEVLMPQTVKNEPSPKREAERKNPFLTVVESPGLYNKLLEYEDLPNTYSHEKAAGVFLDVLRSLYPDKNRLANRMKELFDQFSETRDSDMSERPSAEMYSSESFAEGQVLKKFTNTEHKALKKAIEEKIDFSEKTHAGLSRMRFTEQFVFHSFINFLKQING